MTYSSRADVPCYQLSPHLCLERFTEAAILFVGDREMLVRINLSAAQLLEELMIFAGDRRFSRSECLLFLREHYKLSIEDAAERMRSLLAFCLRKHVVLRVDTDPRSLS